MRAYLNLVIIIAVVEETNKTLIAIPAWNEEKHIGKVVNELLNAGLNQIIVIDDGSTDNTAQIARSYGARVLSHLFNIGVGGAFSTALIYAKEKGYNYLLTMDGDGQHWVGDVVSLYREIKKNGSDVICGSRFLENSKEIPVIRRLVLKVSNLLTSHLFGIPTTDSQSGLRAFSRQAIVNIEIHGLGYEVSSEIFSEISKKELVYSEISSRAIYSRYSIQKGQKLLNGLTVAFKLLALKFNL